MGGIGNQLFQISAGFAHAKKIQTDYAINYKIGLGNGQGYHHRRYRDTLYKNIPETNHNVFIPYQDPKFSYTPISKLNNLCLIGYFQSKKYFLGYEEEVKSLFEFPNFLSNKVLNKLNKIKKKKVGIHLRLGDYRAKSIEGVFHKIDYSLYLNDAIKHFGDDYEFLIFSDDLSLLKQEVNLKNFVNLKNDNEIEDLYSLSQCDSVIMSNSSFSWWGAFLGKTKEKVICPDKWFGPRGPKNSQDLYEDSWINISV
tara:strand:+ start:582 stop:1343 length:762 start_codon:yes stop_codon:yes gene_type:complete